MKKIFDSKRIVRAAAWLVLGCAALTGCFGLPARAFAEGLAREIDELLPVGFYRRVLEARMDPDDLLLVADRDGSAAAFDTDVPAAETMVAASLRVDAMATEELESGAYSFEEPLVITDPYQNSPLTGLILFTTQEPCGVRVTVRGKTEAADIRYDLPEAQAHRVPVIGLYPGAETVVALELTDAAGSLVGSREIAMQAESLPRFMRGAITPVKTSGESAYGLTLVYGQKSSFPFGYDCNGDIRWYLNHKVGNYGMYVLSGGRLIAQDTMGYSHNLEKPQSTNLYELDLLGRYWRMYYLANGSHHEVIEKEPGGNLLCLTSSMENHYEDEIVELDRQTGAVVNELELTDIFGDTYTNLLDWAHINTVSWQKDADTVILSCRNIHSVLKVDWTRHALVWILGNPEFWQDTPFSDYVLKPLGDFHWQYQQHTAYQLDTDMDGNPNTVEISLFDNHTQEYREVPFYDGLEDSYAMIFAVDEAAKTVSLVRDLTVIRSDITSNVIYEPESDRLFAMCGYVPKELWKGREGMTYEFDYATGEILNQFSLLHSFYRASPVVIDPVDLSSPMRVEEDYIKGTLKQAVETADTVEIPEQVLEDDRVTLSTVGQALYLTAPDHTVSQVIFKGEAHTYVYDAASIREYYDKYRDFSVPMAIPMQAFAPDDYRLLVVYRDELYDLGKHVRIP